MPRVIASGLSADAASWSVASISTATLMVSIGGASVQSRHPDASSAAAERRRSSGPVGDPAPQGHDDAPGIPRSGSSVTMPPFMIRGEIGAVIALLSRTAGCRTTMLRPQRVRCDPHPRVLRNERTVLARGALIGTKTCPGSLARPASSACRAAAERLASANETPCNASRPICMRTAARAEGG
jgi:hypothetical protein